MYLRSGTLIIEDVPLQPNLRDDDVGDLCCVHLFVDNRWCTFITVYINPGVPFNALKDFFLKFRGHLQPSDDCESPAPPLILCGDFNYNVAHESNQSQLTAFLKDHFNLVLANDPQKSTTNNRTCIDLIFTRNVPQPICVPRISYFSYHKPLFAILS